MEGGKRVLAGDVCWFSERFYLRQTRRRDGADGFDIGNEKPLASGRNPTTIIIFDETYPRSVGVPLF